MTYSPILSLCTAAFELAAAGWACATRGRRRILLPAAALLVFLAAYQIIEAVLCTDPARFPALGRVAFMVVLWLPATGLLLLTFLTPALRRFLAIYTALFFAGAVALFVWLLVDRTPFTLTVCQVVFAKYGGVMAPALNIAYGAYYQLGLMSLLVISAVGTVRTPEPRERKLIGQMLYGSLAFIIPTIVVVNLFDITQGAFASILCHFALLLAVFIARLIWLEGRK